MTKCKTCMTLRAKLVLWLGKKLGVMEDAKPVPKQEQRMEFTPQQAMELIGAKELELAILRGQLQAALKRIAELDPASNVVPLKVETQ